MDSSSPEAIPAPVAPPPDDSAERPGVVEVVSSRLARHPEWTLPGALVLLMMAVVFVWPSSAPDDDEPVGVVRAFLDAARVGDVDRALELAVIDVPYADTTFLNSGALNGNWRVTAVAEDEPDRPSWRDEMVVNAVITSEDGKSVKGGFDVKRDGEDGPWRLQNPFVQATFRPGALWYIDVNGMTAPFTMPPGDTVSNALNPTYLLLPGVYQFYSDVPGLLDVATEPAPMLPGGSSSYALSRMSNVTVEAPVFTFTPEGTQAAQTAVNAYVDNCASVPALAVVGCPFGAEYVPDPSGKDALYNVVRGITWTVAKYPVVAAVPQKGSVLLTDRERGVVKLSGESADSAHLRLTMECPIKTSRLEMGVLPGGGLRIIPEGYRFQLDKLGGDPTLWRTCDWHR